jgi:hypothetical protein
MAAKKNGEASRLTREELQQIVDGMTAGDVFSSTGGETKPNEVALSIFNRAAERLDYGANAIDRVGIGDTTYLSDLLGEALNMGSKAAGDSSQSPTSADTGDSPQS